MEYRIDLDFCLDRRAAGRENMDKERARGSPTPQSTAGVFDGAFSFSIPLHVLYPDMPSPADALLSGGARAGEVDHRGGDPQTPGGASAIASVQLQALRCLESNNVILPIRVQS